MSAAQLLAELRARDCDVTALDERLRVDAPAGVLTPDLRAVIAQHKPELLALLVAEAARASVEAITAECRRRWARSLELDRSDSPEDRFLAEHHRSEVRLMVTTRWLPALRRWARLEHRLRRLDPEYRWLVDTVDEHGDPA